MNTGPELMCSKSFTPEEAKEIFEHLGYYVFSDDVSFPVSPGLEFALFLKKLGYELNPDSPICLEYKKTTTEKK